MKIQTLQEKLIEKSQEAFSMAIEIYNKPTIKYRVEGFSFFICNAWELMLKAYMINTWGEPSIYYKDKTNRTITLENCLQKVFSNEKSPLRRNLDQIIELRNTSTHFIVEEYEMLYIPLFQACVLNYVNKMQELLDVDITEIIPQNFLTLSVSMKTLTETMIRAKYPEQIAEKFLEKTEELEPMISENNQTFAIQIEHLHFITKDRSEATSMLHIAKEGETGVKIVRELKNPNVTHKFTMKKAIKEINQRLRKLQIPYEINSYFFNLFNKKYNIKENELYCFVHRQYATPSYTYSMQMIELVVGEIQKNPEKFNENLKK